MDWEDCVVDVHSVKLSKQVLESMFKKCGPVRSVTHWKGQGEKPHIFFEYKTPSSTDSARAVGLDRSDLQVIKISNNEMLKKKFRELAHGPLRDRPTSHSTYSYSTRDTVTNTAGKDHRLPEKPATIPAYTSERDAAARYVDFRSEKVRSRNTDPWYSASSSSSSSTSTYSETRATRLSPFKPNPPRASSTAGMTPFQSSPRDISNSRTRGSRRSLSRDRADGRETRHSRDTLPASSRTYPSTPPEEVPSGSKSRLSTSNISPAIIEIPHAGEVIKFDLDRQLEADPVGIIRILSAVKADQKLWMMTAAHYNGKRNLESAKKVLEAGIEMAVRVGEESDTKPFWHLLGQINSSLQAEASTISSVLSVSPITPSFTNNSDTTGQVHRPEPSHIESSPFTKGIFCTEKPRLPSIPHDSSQTASPVKPSVPSSSELSNHLSDAVTLPHISLPLPHARPTGPRKRDSQGPPPPSSPAPPSGPMSSSARLHNLQSEVGALREKQNAVMEDLSFARAAKRRAEDEVKEERSVRRKLEKHLRATEDALARSKRMEDAALDQVKREVEARRKAEALLAEVKARKDRAEAAGPVAGPALFAHPSAANDAAVLFHLASMIRGVPSGDFAAALQFGTAGAGSDTSSTRLGLGEPTNNPQSRT